MGSNGIITAAEVGTLQRDQVIAMVQAADHPDAEAVLVPDTAMHTLQIVDDLEAAVGKPVLTANQVTVWKGLQLLGPVPRLAGVGSLFTVTGERQ
jgi:maleate cis-trans isomerase